MNDTSDVNTVVLRGTISSEPRVRELPSGSIVTQLELTTRVGGSTSSVPVALHDKTVRSGAGDDVVVVGHVHRRFFRAGGVTQSRTEVVATHVVRTTRRKSIERLITTTADELRRDLLDVC